jgi:hypothetical protein
MSLVCAGTPTAPLGVSESALRTYEGKLPATVAPECDHRTDRRRYHIGPDVISEAFSVPSADSS